MLAQTVIEKMLARECFTLKMPFLKIIFKFLISDLYTEEFLCILI